MGEEPLVGLWKVEDACKTSMTGTLETSPYQTAALATRAHGIYNLLRSTHTYGAVGSAVQNPQRQLVKTTVIPNGATAAECHGGSKTVGIGACQIDGAETTQAHTYNIYAVGIDSIAAFSPLDEAHHLLRTPSAARILRGKHDSIELETMFLDGI